MCTLSVHFPRTHRVRARGSVARAPHANRFVASMLGSIACAAVMSRCEPGPARGAWTNVVRDRQTLWLRHTNRHFRRTKFGFFFRRWMLRVLRPITTHAADSLVQCVGNASTPLTLKYGDTAAQRATGQAYGPWERNHHGTSQPGVSMRGRGSMHTAAPPVPSLRSLHSPTHPSIRSLHFPTHP